MDILHREEAFSYEAQYTTALKPPRTLKHGDVFSTTCLYNSAARAEPTEFGLASLQEMCLHAQLVYPEDCGAPTDGLRACRQYGMMTVSYCFSVCTLRTAVRLLLACVHLQSVKVIVDCGAQLDAFRALPTCIA